jgi:RNA recognition motif-containing protein
VSFLLQNIGRNFNISSSSNIVDEYIPPHAILFVQKIPAGTTEEALTALFQQ